MDHKDAYKRWLGYDDLQLFLRQELAMIENQDEEIAERFHRYLEFGTGGMRGIIGAGTNRMNIYTVRKVTLALARYIQKRGDAGENSVVIAYDSRLHSQLFAEETGLVLANNGIRAYIFNTLTPTPILSYAVRWLHSTAGVVITASHNPKEYNGYKIYWADGGQITDHHAEGISQELNNIDNELTIQVSTKEQAMAEKLYSPLDNSVLESYLEKVKDLVVRKDLLPTIASGISIIYTPLHGTGYLPVTRVLKETGFTAVKTVAEQCRPDPSFSTLPCPNPEDYSSFACALRLAAEEPVDIILATDPDADRVGVVAKQKGEYIALTGNQLAALLIDYILSMKRILGQVPSRGFIIKTIVSSDLGAKIAAAYGMSCYEVLTGFKYIGEKIAELYSRGTGEFVFGYEESYGYLYGDFVRDKDAVQACLLICEMAAYHKSQGITLYERLQQLFAAYGYVAEDLISLSYTGVVGQATINRIMEEFRSRVHELYSRCRLDEIKDYYTRKYYTNEGCFTLNSELPWANVIHYRRADGTWFCLRPSGTEPKLKIYLNTCGVSEAEAKRQMQKCKRVVLELIKSVES